VQNLKCYKVSLLIVCTGTVDVPQRSDGRYSTSFSHSKWRVDLRAQGRSRTVSANASLQRQRGVQLLASRIIQICVRWACAVAIWLLPTAKVVFTGYCHVPNNSLYRCQRARDGWDGVLDHPAVSSNMAQLPHKINRRRTGIYDATVVCFRCAFWHICHLAEIQYRIAGATAMFLRIVYDQLGTV
jgi:hypothetical protein